MVSKKLELRFRKIYEMIVLYYVSNFCCAKQSGINMIVLVILRQYFQMNIVYDDIILMMLNNILKRYDYVKILSLSLFGIYLSLIQQQVLHILFQIAEA
jgi:hypothetical protein